MSFLDGSEPTPPISITTATATSSNPDFLRWKRQDQLILHALLASLTEAVIPLIASSTTSSAAWTCLDRIFSKRSPSHIIHLKDKLFSLQRGTLPIFEFLLQAMLINKLLLLCALLIPRLLLKNCLINSLIMKPIFMTLTLHSYLLLLVSITPLPFCHPRTWPLPAVYRTTTVPCLVDCHHRTLFMGCCLHFLQPSINLHATLIVTALIVQLFISIALVLDTLLLYAGISFLIFGFLSHLLMLSPLSLLHLFLGYSTPVLLIISSLISRISLSLTLMTALTMFCYVTILNLEYLTLVQFP
ncbi:hypothetical protein C2S52_003032 [Perilla frutescens var. hirtella]|nr:hypothetical protein C2S51_012434 [Perilla frutescens var. frutescens]KAH6792555.1 hypothetical protein C2S52_003032 [Perilla frutescens var. hirtella]